MICYKLKHELKQSPPTMQASHKNTNRLDRESRIRCPHNGEPEQRLTGRAVNKVTQSTGRPSKSKRRLQALIDMVML
ncbi:MAG: hypothetical protein DJ555_07775 [Desulfurococcaceae archaeon]|nr:MAG: hypothetical protein DJ555_07775 [Desulfurococcaceae archaeon]